jgi:predicted phosphodiesterase
MRRIALLSDIHGNLPALDAVVSDIAATGLTDVYCLGDLVGYGPDPAGVIDRVRSMDVPTVLGNYDEGIALRRGECGCYYATDQSRSDGAASYRFTEPLVDDERAAWLASRPQELRFEERGVRCLLAHGSPRKINEYLLPDRTDELLARLAEAAGADVVCVGHVHVPYHRLVLTSSGAPVHYVSAGSVGKPKDGDPRACWVELFLGEATEIAAAAPDDRAAGPAGGGDLSVAAAFHRVPYDIDAVAAAMTASGLPATLVASLRTA